MSENLSEFIDLENHFESYNESIKGHIDPEREKILALNYAIFGNKNGEQWLEMMIANINFEITKEHGNNLGYKLAALQGKLKLIGDIRSMLFAYNQSQVNREVG